MKVTEKFITTFTAEKAEAIITAGTKLDRRHTSLIDRGLDYSKNTISLSSKIALHNEKWNAIAELIDENHSQYAAICMTGFLDI